ncbi:MAG: phosphotransacetylase family protein [Archaeoglobi archaeon]|jgi:BioD-like phosphotransacetylase family protein|nr:phosphotransacetylase family protein [Archaeoglobi archaeon]
MKKLMISSTESFSGKSGVALSLALILEDKGYDVGYFKILGTNPIRLGNRICDEDAKLAEEVLGLKDACAIVLDRPYIDFVVSEDPERLKNLVLERMKGQSEKDIILIEGAPNYLIGTSVGICDVYMAKTLDCKVLMVSKFGDFFVDELISAKRFFEDRLQKVVLNEVTGYKKTYIDLISRNILKKHDLDLIGTIPRDPALIGLKVNEIAEVINGKYLVRPKKDENVEQILVGAMKTDTALSYLRSARNYALITGGDRGDLITLAIESGAKCIIATGNFEPPAHVLSLAEKKEIAVLLAKEDTATTLSRIQEKFGRIRMSKEKLYRMRELVEESICVDELLKYLEL